MRFKSTPLAGSFVIEMQPIRDDRGHFARAFCVSELQDQGLNSAIEQCNVARSFSRGTLRGIHFQLAPHAECKLIRCTRGAIYNVIVDLRPKSPTFCQWFAAELTEENGAMVYSPEGFANGYQTLTDGAEICYSTSHRFSPAAARGLRFDDPTFDIRWPLEISQISQQDRQWPDFDRGVPAAGVGSGKGDHR